MSFCRWPSLVIPPVAIPCHSAGGRPLSFRRWPPLVIPPVAAPCHSACGRPLSFRAKRGISNCPTKYDSPPMRFLTAFGMTDHLSPAPQHTCPTSSLPCAFLLGRGVVGLVICHLSPVLISPALMLSALMLPALMLFSGFQGFRVSGFAVWYLLFVSRPSQVRQPHL